MGTDCHDCKVRAFATCRPEHDASCLEAYLSNGVCDDGEPDAGHAFDETPEADSCTDIRDDFEAIAEHM